MKIEKYTDVKEEKIVMEGAKGANIRWLISAKDKAPNFAMRRFRIEVGGFTPYHHHDFEHEVYILEGEGLMMLEEGEVSIAKDSFVFVEPNEMHQFKNVGNSELVFLCMVPV